MKVLVFGASGMIGSAMFRVLGEYKDLQVWGTLRSSDARKYFLPYQTERLIGGVDAESQDSLARVFSVVRPDVVVNCIGLTKHHRRAEDPRQAVLLNALLPHRLADLCGAAGARLIHVSTDCVFAGTKGNYLESDGPDALDLYGRTKHLGEVDYPHAVTLRTSTIGHELNSQCGLLEWFLAQQGSCKGFSRVIFSGLPNEEFARVVRDHVIPRAELCGLYHVGSEAIDKYHLLLEIASVYGKQIDIRRDEGFAIDRSLNSGRFRQVSGYVPAAWPELIRAMYTARVKG
jgi:dTDP-4-dehydrorhamnose reductase